MVLAMLNVGGKFCPKCVCSVPIKFASCRITIRVCSDY